MYQQIASNKRRSAALIFGFVLLVVLVGVVVGYLVGGGPTASVVALVIAAVMAVTSYWKSDAIALSVSRAVPADPATYQRLHNLVEGLWSAISNKCQTRRRIDTSFDAKDIFALP